MVLILILTPTAAHRWQPEPSQANSFGQSAHSPLNDFGDLSFPLGDGALLVAELVELLLQDPLLALEPLAVLRSLETTKNTNGSWMAPGDGVQGTDRVSYAFQLGQDSLGLLQEELLLALVGPPRLHDDLFVLHSVLLARLFQFLLEEAGLEQPK